MSWQYSAEFPCPVCGAPLNYSLTREQRLSKMELDEVVFRFDCPAHGLTERKGAQLNKIQEREI